MAKDHFDADLSSFSQEFGEDTDFKQAIKVLSDPKKVKWHTQLADEEITKITRVLSMVSLLRLFGVDVADVVRSAVKEKLVLRASYNRLGRKEHVDAFKRESVWGQEGSREVWYRGDDVKK